MKDSEILKKARTLIRQGECRAICTALERVGIRLNIDWNQIIKLKGWIRKMLGPFPYYEDWLSGKHPAVLVKMEQKDFRAGRIQWLDWMIAECIKEGK